MSTAAPAVATEPKKGIRWRRLLIEIAIIAIFAAAAELLGLDIRGWLEAVWDTMNNISVASLIAAIVLKTAQTTLTAFAWYSILRFAFPGKVRWLEILASYAASVALNAVLPANIGTLVMLLMFTTIIAGATFASILGAYAVEKIFWTLIGAFVYLYLFLSVSGSFDIKFNFVSKHPFSLLIMLLAAAYILYVLLRRLWPRVLRWWDEAKGGGAILVHPKKYLLTVFLPCFLAWVASLGVMAVFLHAYDISVSFDTLMRIAGGNSIANVTSVTPGGAGVTQAFNVASLNGVATSQEATAYSVAQQLVTTAWSIVFGIAMVTWAFGWTGGKGLVERSYVEAKEKAAEQQAARAAKKAARKEAEAAEPS
jgi:uncharacterized membrane protein YbhN (UPF0104 family)